MKAEQTDTFLACTDDNDFRKKYAIAAACSLGSVFILPLVLLLGYLSETMKRAGLGRKGLPEWGNWGETVQLGGIALLSLLYLLPSALLTALSMLPDARSFFSFTALISRFILCGSLLAFMVGLTFSIVALHAYLKSGRIGDLFQVAALHRTIMSNKSELGGLAMLATAAVAGVGALNWLLGWLGYPLGVLCSTLVALIVYYNAGRALGMTEAPSPDEPEEEDGPPTDAWIPT